MGSKTNPQLDGPQFLDVMTLRRLRDTLSTDEYQKILDSPDFDTQSSEEILSNPARYQSGEDMNETAESRMNKNPYLAKFMEQESYNKDLENIIGREVEVVTIEGGLWIGELIGYDIYRIRIRRLNGEVESFRHVDPALLLEKKPCPLKVFRNSGREIVRGRAPEFQVGDPPST